MAAMYGRALKHQEQSAVERACGSVFQDFWDRHNWLDAVLTNRIQALFKKIQCCGDCVDPVLSFANMVAQATMLSLYKTMRSMELAANECRSTVLAFEQRSLDAADKIVASTAEIRQGAFFHVGLPLWCPKGNSLIKIRSIPLHPYLFASVQISSNLTRTSMLTSMRNSLKY